MLPPFPELLLSIEEDRTSEARCDEGFVKLRRRRLRMTFPDGQTSAPFAYDEAYREALDAVAIAAYFRLQGRNYVYLRSAFRPPVALRPREVWPTPEYGHLGHLWELPAGLVEPDERSPEGLRRCAARELEEELGFKVELSSLWQLGSSLFPTPSLIAERIFFFAVQVEPNTRGEPTLDGSALEQHAAIAALPLDGALKAINSGLIEDMKTEVGIRRLAEALAP